MRQSVSQGGRTSVEFRYPPADTTPNPKRTIRKDRNGASASARRLASSFEGGRNVLRLFFLGCWLSFALSVAWALVVVALRPCDRLDPVQPPEEVLWLYSRHRGAGRSRVVPEVEVHGTEIEVIIWCSIFVRELSKCSLVVADRDLEQ